MSLLKNQRLELDKKDRLKEQLKLEEFQLQGAESHKKFLLQQRSDLFAKNRSLTPESLLAREEEELEGLHKIVNYKLPAMIKITERQVSALKNTEFRSSEGRLDLGLLRRKV